jgi:hypothetical protein
VEDAVYHLRNNITQVYLASALITLLLSYASIWSIVADIVLTLIAVVSVVVLLESRRVLADFINFKVRHLLCDLLP